MPSSLNHLKQYLAYNRYKNVTEGMHEKKYDCARYLEEEIKTHHLGTEENVALMVALNQGPETKRETI